MFQINHEFQSQRITNILTACRKSKILNPGLMWDAVVCASSCGWVSALGASENICRFVSPEACNQGCLCRMGGWPALNTEYSQTVSNIIIIMVYEHHDQYGYGHYAGTSSSPWLLRASSRRAFTPATLQTRTPWWWSCWGIILTFMLVWRIWMIIRALVTTMMTTTSLPTLASSSFPLNRSISSACLRHSAVTRVRWAPTFEARCLESSLEFPRQVHPALMCGQASKPCSLFDLLVPFCSLWSCFSLAFWFFMKPWLCVGPNSGQCFPPWWFPAPGVPQWCFPSFPPSAGFSSPLVTFSLPLHSFLEVEISKWPKWWSLDHYHDHQHR